LLADLSQVDHIVYAAPDLDQAVDQFERLSGIRASSGGSHPGMGTRNALISLGPDSYLEIVAPDRAQVDYRSPRVFRIDSLDRPRIVTWAAKGDDIEQLAAAETGGEAILGAAMSGSRKTPNGASLGWQLTDPYREVADGVIPFFINWGDTPHPAGTAASGATLTGFRVEHPDSAFVRGIFDTLGLSIAVTDGTEPLLIAEIDTPNGRLDLR
jgi:hypothetical protein